MRELQLALPGVVADSPLDWVWSEADRAEGFVDIRTHATVMQGEVLNALDPKGGGTYVDVTLGYGGHTEALLRVAEGVRVIAMDRDQSAIDSSKGRLTAFEGRVSFVRTPFSRLREALAEVDVTQVDGLCADLGFSSPQIDDPGRGMSFRNSGPIDMRMDQESGETALDVIERVSESELADILYHYGDEKRSRRIARSIKRALEAGELETTIDLRRAIIRAVGPVRVSGIDPATRTFQALRMAVNDELGELSTLLSSLAGALKPGGVAAIISFHSAEDRLVKRHFADRDLWAPLWKKPLIAGDDEANANPRARSAKLRAARKLLPEGDRQ